MADPPSSSDSPTPPSYLLEGRYLAEKLVAHGDTADVFSGTDTWSGEIVAIRMLRADRRDRASAFRRMSERLFGTASAKLLRAMHIGEDRDGNPFLVTELLMGRDVERLGRVRWEVACEVTRQAAAAIAEMHISGLHHGAPFTFDRRRAGLEDALGRWLYGDEEIGAIDVASELKAIIDAANSEFWAGGPPSSSGAHALPRPSMISVAGPSVESVDDDDE
jgi:hypothetical protein